MSEFESPEMRPPLTSATPTHKLGWRSPDNDTPFGGSQEESPIPRSPSPVRASRIKSALSTISSTSSQYLEPPPLDLRPEQRLRSSEEAMVDQRKRDREILKNMKKKVMQFKLFKSLSQHLLQFSHIPIPYIYILNETDFTEIYFSLSHSDFKGEQYGN